MLLIYLLMNYKIAVYFAIYCSPAMTEHHERKQLGEERGLSYLMVSSPPFPFPSITH